MRRARHPVACALAVALAAGSASAQDVVAGDFPLDIATPPTPGFDPVPPEDFLHEAAAMVDWIVANSRYTEAVSLPAFVMLPRATLNYIFYSQMVGGYQGQDCVNAIYVPHIMLLADDFERAACSDILVHELVHHFQFITRVPFRCTAESEREAYEIQAKWTRETGVGVLPSPLFLRRLTCDNPHDWSR